MSQAATTKFIDVALPFINPIEQGLSVLLGGGSGGLEIGLYKGFQSGVRLPQTGYYAAIQASDRQVDVKNLRVDNYQKLVDDQSGAVIPYSHFLFSISRAVIRDDWREIPAVKTSYLALLKALPLNDDAKLNDALAAFKLSVRACPDLLSKDKSPIIEKVTAQVSDVTAAPAAGPIATPHAAGAAIGQPQGIISPPPPRSLPKLEDVQL